MIQRIMDRDRLLAIIVSGDCREAGINFLTADDQPLQLALATHSKSHVIRPHVHTPSPREVRDTQEVLIIRKGRMRVDFYDDTRAYLESRILEEGDIILLAAGGHGFEALEEVEFVEVKTGPYQGDKDKRRFDPVPSEKVNLK